jgi:tetratricopeptide (TPR) repeat protein
MRRFVPRALLMTAAMAAAVGCASSGGGGGGVSLGGDTGGRYLVMIPALQGPEGDRVAAELRTLVADMQFYTSINDRDVRRAMEQYGVTELNDVFARQLGGQINAQLVTWGEVSQGGSGLQADMRVIDTRTGDEITISDATGTGPRELAADLFSEFEQAMQGVRQAVFCNDYLSSDQYDRALEACNEALAIVPTNSAALYGKATALLNLERFEEALAGYDELLSRDPTHQDALLGAGFAASQLERIDDARGFYRRYMEVNPGNVEVRMSVAYDVAQTGDYISAYDLLQPAVAENQDNTDFQRFLFSIATEAGRRLNTAGDSAQAREAFTNALAAYQAGYSNGEGLEASALSQAIAVNNALGRTQDALRLATDATQRFPQDPQMWDQLARVHSQAESHAEAITALNRVLEIDPSYEDGYIRRGQAYLQAGQRQQALADFQRAASAGDRDRVAALLYNEGARAFQAQNYAEAANTLSTAHEYSQGETRRNVEFVWGAALAQQANALARSNIEAGNRATAQRALDMARESERLLQTSGHPSAAGVLSGVRQLIASQEALLDSR